MYSYVHSSLKKIFVSTFEKILGQSLILRYFSSGFVTEFPDRSHVLIVHSWGLKNAAPRLKKNLLGDFPPLRMLGHDASILVTGYRAVFVQDIK